MRTKEIPFDVLVADPPWQFGDKLPGRTRGAERNYSTLSLRQLCDFPIPPVGDNAILFLWKVAAIPDWLTVCRAWRFEPKAEMVWVKIGTDRPGNSWDVDMITRPGAQVAKLAFGMGRKVRNCHEVCVIAQRGKGIEPASKSVRSVFFAPLREHSRKPEEFYAMVNRLYPNARKVELFARTIREGWTCLGDEAGVFAAGATTGVGTPLAGDDVQQR